MAAIIEDYISFETAKLLKEKGFNEECFALYNPDGTLIQSGIRLNNIQVGRVEGSYSAPTLQMAMKWLREVHHIFITIVPQEVRLNVDKLCYGIYRVTEDLYQPLYNGRVDSLVDSHEESVEAALKYVLENLI